MLFLLAFLRLLCDAGGVEIHVFFSCESNIELLVSLTLNSQTPTHHTANHDSPTGRNPPRGRRHDRPGRRLPHRLLRLRRRHLRRHPHQARRRLPRRRRRLHPRRLRQAHQVRRRGREGRRPRTLLPRSHGLPHPGHGRRRVARGEGLHGGVGRRRQEDAGEDGQGRVRLRRLHDAEQNGVQDGEHGGSGQDAAGDGRNDRRFADEAGRD
mmetsp:Transcript_26003/g.47153  ORF Transcript_26003/g.47153 Transcript_26003/m.47153 type:complete len:210 (-) Transcript_26003:486-1115(-)